MNALATSTPMQNGNASSRGTGDAPASAKKPKGLIEKMYQKKSQLEHVLLRPDTYIGKFVNITVNIKRSKCITKYLCTVQDPLKK